MHHFSLLICVVFSFSISAQGILKSKSFYQDEDFISITRSIKPTSKSLASYTAYTHSQEGATCVTHALAQGMTILHCIQKRSTSKVDNSMKSFSPYFTYLNIESDFDAGLYVDETLAYVEQYGNPLISIVEYDRFYPFSDEVLDRLDKLSFTAQSKIKEEALYFKLSKWKKVDSVEGVKQSIAQGFPVMYSIDYAGISSFEDDLYECNTQDCFWYPKQEEKLDIGGISPHAMLIVGYDDSKAAVQVLNSWGEDFGNEGYFWIKYKDLFTSFIYTEIDDTWKTDHEWCWLDTGSGYCFPEGDETTYFPFTDEETRKAMIDYENYWNVSLPRGGKGFGSEAFSLQGIDIHPKLIFNDDDTYVPQLMRQKDKNSILEEYPYFSNSKWFTEVDVEFKNQ